MHADVCRQSAGAHGSDIVQMRVVLAELTLQEGLGKAALEVARGCRHCQGQGGVNGEAALTVRGDAPIQGVDQPVGLAQAKRRGHDDVVATGVEDFIDTAFDVDQLPDAWHAGAQGFGIGILLRAGKKLRFRVHVSIQLGYDRSPSEATHG